LFFFFFSSRRRHTRWPRDWSSDVCSSDLGIKSTQLAMPRNMPLSMVPLRNAKFDAKRYLIGMASWVDLMPSSRHRHFRSQSTARSEERRVGKECRSRWSTDEIKKENEKRL